MNDLCSMRTSIFPLLLVGMTLTLSAQNLRETYITDYASMAVSEMRRSGVPASITLAQGILESGNGQSRLATEGRNHFGIKCHDGWTGQTMYVDDDKPDECFRVYRKVKKSYRDHSDFLTGRSRYADLFLLDPRDFRSWAHGLKSAGYATNPAYAERLISIIESENLQQFDAKVVATPGRGIGAHPRYVRHPNGSGYMLLDDSESLELFSEQIGIPVSRLLAFNDRDVDAYWQGGDKVYVKKKSASSGKRLPYCRAKDGDDAWSISQRYGIRLGRLYQINQWPVGYQPASGELVTLR